MNKFFNSKRTKFTYDKQINIGLYNDENFCRLSHEKRLKNYKSKMDKFTEKFWFYYCLTNVVVDYLYKLPSLVTCLTFGVYFNQNT